MIVGITGASGAIYGIRLLEELAKKEIKTHLIISRWGERTILHETDYLLESILSLATETYDIEEYQASIASGSKITRGMVIAPCSMKTLSAISSGYGDNLLTRAADVTIKERRRLILLPRETPLSPIHLSHLLHLSKLGVVILPPVPAFYHHPQTIDDIINHTVGRVLDHLEIHHSLGGRWEEIQRD